MQRAKVGLVTPADECRQSRSLYLLQKWRRVAIRVAAFITCPYVWWDQPSGGLKTLVTLRDNTKVMGSESAKASTTLPKSPSHGKVLA